MPQPVLYHERNGEKMAPKTAAASNVDSVSDEGWETVIEEYGETWNPKDPAVLIGTYHGSKTVPVDDPNNPGAKRDVLCYEVTDNSGKRWSLWSSYNLDAGFAEVSDGDSVRVEFVSTIPLDGGRTVKQYRIARKSAS
jgi:hypothetical protein